MYKCEILYITCTDGLHYCVHNCTVELYTPVCQLASVLSTNHRRASIYLLCSDWSISHPLEPEPKPDLELNHSMLTTSFPKGNGRGKKEEEKRLIPKIVAYLSLLRWSHIPRLDQ